MTTQYFAACPKGLENLLFNELNTLGAIDVRETVAGVYFSGDAELLYKACLWSRLANKILFPLAAFSMSDEQALYNAIHAIAWEEHLEVDGTFKVDFLGTDQSIRNTQFGAVRVKDAIVDRFQERYGSRPSVDKKYPHIIVNARLSKGKLHVSLDLSGQSLHRRGYRQKQGEAPLKENLASAILLRAQWQEIADQGGYLIDPMCGSGTLLIEGFMMAADIAPGLMRSREQWGFTHWKQFDDKLWQQVVSDAKSRKQLGIKKCIDKGFECRGYDNDWRVINAAENNIERAGFEEWIRVSCKPIEEFTKPTHHPMARGLLISNPPYGERLGEEKELEPLYKRLGQVLRDEFIGWQAGIITSNQHLAKKMAIRANKKYKFLNGTLAAEFLLFAIQPEYFYKELAGKKTESDSINTPTKITFNDLSDGGKMVCNRLQKNKKQLRKWLNKEQIDCYRLYDADIPEYAAAIDVYGDNIHVQEYAAPNSIDERKARERFQALLDAVTVALDVDSNCLFIKQRRRNKGKQQYQKENAENAAYNNNYSGDARAPLVVKEGRASLLVDLWSYLDTGLFLDHRPVRKMIASMAVGKQFLNLFCYTATATVHAVLGNNDVNTMSNAQSKEPKEFYGAASSISVDMSKTYIDWAKRNYEKNNINLERHQLIQQDCLIWLKNCRQGFDLILLDPPSFSNSKRMDDVLDIQRDHIGLINRCMELLNPGGALIFSNNLRSFTLDENALQDYVIENITEKTLDPDFQRNRKIHHCWLIKNPKA